MTFPASLGEPLEHIAHSLSDICLNLDAMHEDLQDIRALVEHRADLEARLSDLERMVQAALMSDGMDDADDALS